MRTAILIIAVFLLTGCKHRSEESLIKDFNDHRGKFEELLGSFRGDSGVVLITHSEVFYYNEADPNLSSESVRIYRDRLASLRLHGLHRPNAESIRFLTGSPNLLMQSSKDFVYTPNVPSPLVESIDAYEKPIGEQRLVYKRISDNWYLSYESW